MCERANVPSSVSPRSWRIVHTESSLGWGGQERRIFAELTGFKRRGSRVWLVAPAGSEIHQRASEADIPVCAMNFCRSTLPWNVLKLTTWLRRERIDVVNPHSSRDAWVAGLAGRLARVSLIVRTRHFDVPIPNPAISRYVYGSLSDHVLTTSPKVTEHLQQLFDLPHERISTVPTGIDLEIFSPWGPKATLAPNEQHGTPVLIGMISVIRLAKGHETLLRALRLLIDKGHALHCIVVGEGPYRGNVEEKVRELGLRQAVKFIGHREDVPEILRALDILVIPSLHEGIPQVALQALATKTPVIASNVGGIPSVIRADLTGRLVPPGDAAALAAAIRQTLADKTTTQQCCERGRTLVEAEHGVDRMLDKLEEVYCRRVPL